MNREAREALKRLPKDERIVILDLIEEIQTLATIRQIPANPPSSPNVNELSLTLGQLQSQVASLKSTVETMSQDYRAILPEYQYLKACLDTQIPKVDAKCNQLLKIMKDTFPAKAQQRDDTTHYSITPAALAEYEKALGEDLRRVEDTKETPV